MFHGGCVPLEECANRVNRASRSSGWPRYSCACGRSALSLNATAGSFPATLLQAELLVNGPRRPSAKWSARTAARRESVRLNRGGHLRSIHGNAPSRRLRADGLHRWGRGSSQLSGLLVDRSRNINAQPRQDRRVLATLAAIPRLTSWRQVATSSHSSVRMNVSSTSPRWWPSLSRDAGVSCPRQIGDQSLPVVRDCTSHPLAAALWASCAANSAFAYRSVWLCLCSSSYQAVRWNNIAPV
jgi:hypothetical protein